MKRLLLVACVAAGCVPAAAAPRGQVTPTTFTAPQPYYADSSCGMDYGQVPYRWGWFGADHYPPAPVMHRDYNGGWRQWYYRW